MWREARRQDKKIRNIMVDLKRRAERRREHYERNNREAANALQIFGYSSKLYQLENETDVKLVKWGDRDIDRFDIRFHFDPSELVSLKHHGPKQNKTDTNIYNYERYHILIKSEMAGLNESDVVSNCREYLMRERIGDEVDVDVEMGKVAKSDDDWRRTAESIVEKHKLCESTCLKYKVSVNDFHVHEAEDRRGEAEKRNNHPGSKTAKISSFDAQDGIPPLSFALPSVAPISPEKSKLKQELLESSESDHYRLRNCRNSPTEAFGPERRIFITSYGNDCDEDDEISVAAQISIPEPKIPSRMDGIRRLRESLMQETSGLTIINKSEKRKISESEKGSEDEFEEFNKKTKESCVRRSNVKCSKAEKLKRKTQSLLRRQARIDREDSKRKMDKDEREKRERDDYLMIRTRRDKSSSSSDSGNRERRRSKSRRSDRRKRSRSHGRLREFR